jgi:hypothetical protein
MMKQCLFNPTSNQEEEDPNAQTKILIEMEGPKEQQLEPESPAKIGLQQSVELVKT